MPCAPSAPAEQWEARRPCRRANRPTRPGRVSKRGRDSRGRAAHRPPRAQPRPPSRQAVGLVFVGSRREMKDLVAILEHALPEQLSGQPARQQLDLKRKHRAVVEAMKLIECTAPASRCNFPVTNQTAARNPHVRIHVPAFPNPQRTPPQPWRRRRGPWKHSASALVTNANHSPLQRPAQTPVDDLQVAACGWRREESTQNTQTVAACKQIDLSQRLRRALHATHRLHHHVGANLPSACRLGGEPSSSAPWLRRPPDNTARRWRARRRTCSEPPWGRRLHLSGRRAVGNWRHPAAPPASAEQRRGCRREARAWHRAPGGCCSPRHAARKSGCCRLWMASWLPRRSPRRARTRCRPPARPRSTGACGR